MKKLILLSALFLTGCQTAQIVTTKEQIVITPSVNMYNCPVVSSYPNPKTLTDIEVAKLIVQLDRYNKICKNSIEAIRQYLESAKKTAEKKSD
jgi:uncharacterized lipoprotein YajG